MHYIYYAYVFLRWFTFLFYLITYLHSWLRSYKTGSISEAVGDKAKVNLHGLYKVVPGLSIAAQFPLTEIQLKLPGIATLWIQGDSRFDLT